MSKKKLLTPVGAIKFPKVETETIKDEVKKKWTLSLVLDPEEKEVQKFIAELDKAVSESAYPKTKKVYKEDKSKTDQVDSEGKAIYEPNGKILISFNSNYPINFFDAKKEKIENMELPGFGSKARVSFNLTEVPFYKCLTKYIVGVQIIDLKDGGASADSCGFQEEEGYEGKTDKPKDVPWDE